MRSPRPFSPIVLSLLPSSLSSFFLIFLCLPFFFLISFFLFFIFYFFFLLLFLFSSVFFSLFFYFYFSCFFLPYNSNLNQFTMNGKILIQLLIQFQIKNHNPQTIFIEMNEKTVSKILLDSIFRDPRKISKLLSHSFQ